MCARCRKRLPRQVAVMRARERARALTVGQASRRSCYYRYRPVHDVTHMTDMRSGECPKVNLRLILLTWY
jgi:hypothetical protein